MRALSPTSPDLPVDFLPLAAIKEILATDPHDEDPGKRSIPVPIIT